MQDHDQTRIGRRTLFVRGAVLAGGAAAASLIDTGCSAKIEASNGPSAPLIVAADGNAVDRESMAAELERRGLAEPVARVRKAITTTSVWGARPDAAPADVLMTWKQLIALHRQWHSLLKELKDAEQALGRDSTEANYSWLQDVKARLSVIDGTEAQVEGFGASSGRASPTF